MNNSDKLRLDIQKILVKQKLITKDMVKNEGWSPDLQRGWSRFCGLTSGFKTYANKVPSFATIPLGLTKQLREMASVKVLRAPKKPKVEPKEVAAPKIEKEQVEAVTPVTAEITVQEEVSAPEPTKESNKSEKKSVKKKGSLLSKVFKRKKAK